MFVDLQEWLTSLFKCNKDTNNIQVSNARKKNEHFGLISTKVDIESLRFMVSADYRIRTAVWFGNVICVAFNNNIEPLGQVEDNLFKYRNIGQRKMLPKLVLLWNEYTQRYSHFVGFPTAICKLQSNTLQNLFLKQLNK